MTAAARALQSAAFANRLFPKVAAAAISFLFLVAVARSSSVATYGQAAIIITIAGFVTLFSSLGQRFVVLRRVPSLFEVRRREAVAVAQRSSQIAVFGTVATAILTSALIWLVGAGAVGALGAPALIACAVLVLFQGMLEYFSQLLRALGKGDLSIYLREVLPRIVALGCLGIIAVASGPLRTLTTIVGCLIVGMGISAFATILISRRRLGTKADNARPNMIAHLKEGFRFLPRVAAATFREYMDVLILSLVLPPATVAIYFTLARFSALLIIPGSSLAATLVVEVTKSDAEGDHLKALAAARHLFAQSALVVLPLAALLWLFARPLLAIFSIEAAGYGTTILLVILNGAVVGTFLGIWELMQCLDRATHFHRAFPVIVAVGATAMYLLAATEGIAGLAAAYLATNAAWIGLGLYELFRSGDRP